MSEVDPPLYLKARQGKKLSPSIELISQAFSTVYVRYSMGLRKLQGTVSFCYLAKEMRQKCNGRQGSTATNMSAWSGIDPADFALNQFMECLNALDHVEKAVGCMCVAWSSGKEVVQNLDTQED